jgi:DNA-binding transcriptional regulator/RsmH inhibitor MraZ
MKNEYPENPIVGYHECNFDKKRVTIPQKIANKTSPEAIYYFRYDDRGFIEIGRQIDFPDLSTNFSKYALLSYHEMGTIDASGRITVTKEMIKYLGDVGETLILFGLGTHFGITTPNKLPAVKESLSAPPFIFTSNRHPK